MANDERLKLKGRGAGGANERGTGKRGTVKSPRRAPGVKAKAGNAAPKSAPKAKAKATKAKSRPSAAPKKTQVSPKRKGIQTSKISKPTKTAKLKRRNNIKKRDI